MTTVEEMVEALETKYGRVQRVWVFDRGMVNEENLEFIRRRGGRYVVGTPKAMLKRFETALAGARLAGSSGRRGSQAGQHAGRAGDIRALPQCRAAGERAGDA